MLYNIDASCLRKCYQSKKTESLFYLMKLYFRYNCASSGKASFVYKPLK